MKVEKDSLKTKKDIIEKKVIPFLQKKEVLDKIQQDNMIVDEFDCKFSDKLYIDKKIDAQTCTLNSQIEDFVDNELGSILSKNNNNFYKKKQYYCQQNMQCHFYMVNTIISHLSYWTNMTLTC